jgi:hypothetical protein
MVRTTSFRLASWKADSNETIQPLYGWKLEVILLLAN